MRYLKNPSDIIGARFGKLVVLQYLGVRNSKSRYQCQCDCGRIIDVRRNDLISGNTRTCGNCNHIINDGTHCQYVCQNGDSFYFSPEDLPFIEKHRWWTNNHGYALSYINGKIQRLSRLLLAVDDDLVVDHIDGNPRNNTRENLRIATIQENNQNALVRSHNKTGYKGVFLAVTKEKYEARIVHNGRSIYLGRYETEQEAAKAYDKAARELFGATACLNFPADTERGCRVSA